MKKYALLAAIIAVAAIAIFGSSRTPSKPSSLGQIPSATVQSNTSSTVGPAAVLILADKSDVQIRTCTNIGTSTIYLAFKATSTGFVSLTGRTLIQSSTFELTEQNGNLWTGNIYGLTAAGTTTVSCSQL